MKKRIISIFCLFVFAFGFSPKAEAAEFSDVPSDSWAKDYIARVSELGIMGGYGDGVFGYGDVVTRAEFAAMLPRLFNWSLQSPETPTFSDNKDKSAWYYDDIETAVLNGAVTRDSTRFRPKDSITREEMAEMLVRGLGYSSLSENLKNIKTPFSDVQKNLANIAMAYDFGIIKGTTPTTFNPNGYASREEAATMMIRLYERFFSKISWSHAFYAISSYAQKDLIPGLNSVSFGWSRLETDANGTPFLNTSASSGNIYNRPTGYQEVVQLCKSSGVPDNLSVYASASQKITMPDGTVTDVCSTILNSPENRTKAITQMIAELQRENSYSGVTIDFEEMRGPQLKVSFNLFLQELQAQLLPLGMPLYVCVPPVTSDGYYFDGYDYRAIGTYADKVILMAHDYAAKTLTTAEMNAGFNSTPVTPIYEIYTALKAITDSDTGVQDKSKVVLAISFSAVQWKLKDGKVQNAAALQPDPALIYSRMNSPEAVINYSEKYQNPYITYHNNTDNTDNIGWYEDVRSVNAKMDLARMFGITGISFWRLGLIPVYTDTTDKQIYYDVPSWLAGEK